MKNVMTHISRSKEFCNDEHKMAVKIQIDNSLSLGWKPEDILLVTNFDYEYQGVKSMVVSDDHLCQHHTPATKVYVIDHLFHAGLVTEGLYWYHDFDCFQLSPFTDTDPDLGEADFGLTNYGRMPRLCSASFFFKDTAKDIFHRWQWGIAKRRVDEEREIMWIAGKFKWRIKLLNITYALHKFNIRNCYRVAHHPIRAAHFHLTPDKYDFYVRGHNKLRRPIIPERLIDIFHQHGFTE